ncbi:MAG: hypothetical protein JWQ20_2264 [Conexibacter sp.]|nr:hypothetical protein [Conexibacter sp.]
MADRYLVLFVADTAHDEHADALRATARGVPNAGFFDDPSGAEQRTVGVYVRTDDLSGGAQLLQAVAAVSARTGARFEVQHAEEVLGHLVSGRPDPDLQAALPPGVIPDPL